MSDAHNSMEKPDYFILDAMANDIESVDDVLRILNSNSELGWTDVWGRPFTREDVVGSLVRLLRRQLVQAYSTSESEAALSPLEAGTAPERFGEAYFGLTERGRLVHANWESPEGGT